MRTVNFILHFKRNVKNEFLINCSLVPPVAYEAINISLQTS